MASLNSKPCVLIVDDDDAVRDSLDAYLTLKGMQVTALSSAKDTLNHTGSCVDIVILDVNMPDIDGFALLSMLRGQGQLAPAIFITGLGDPEMRIRAERAGVAAFLDKPIDPLALLATLNRLLT
jgi:FixJ family two-component response regulator